MATLDVQGTKFSFCILPSGEGGECFAKVKIAVENEFIHYEEVNTEFTRAEVEEIVFSLCRLLAGAYGKEYCLAYERAGVAIDLYPFTQDGREVAREERRRKDMQAIVRLLMRSKEKKALIGGVYSILLHKREIAVLAAALRKELDEAFAAFGLGEGEYLFVGVSPKGYQGCNYWYYDPAGLTKKGDFVWVSMGRHNTEQIVSVDCVRYFTKDNAPYDPDEVKKILRKATLEELVAEG